MNELILKYWRAVYKVLHSRCEGDRKFFDRCNRLLLTVLSGSGFLGLLYKRYQFYKKDLLLKCHRWLLQYWRQWKYLNEAIALTAHIPFCFQQDKRKISLCEQRKQKTSVEQYFLSWLKDKPIFNSSFLISNS